MQRPTLKQSIDFIIFCLNQGIDFINIINLWTKLQQYFFGFRVKCLKQGIKNRNSVLNRVRKSAIFVLNRVRVREARPHLPTQGYVEYPPGKQTNNFHRRDFLVSRFMDQMQTPNDYLLFFWT